MDYILATLKQKYGHILMLLLIPLAMHETIGQLSVIIHIAGLIAWSCVWATVTHEFVKQLQISKYGYWID